MSINNWPINERPREKLYSRGATALSNAELLAIFLRTGSHGKTAVDLARELLTEFKGLTPLLSANLNDFKEIKGLGKAKFCQLQAALELGQRYLQEQAAEQGQPLENPQQAYRYLQSHLCNPSQEIFACLFLDNRHRIIKLEKLFHGTLTRTSVYPREVVRAALRHNAAAAILAHNHPSGNTTPSKADYEATKSLCCALNAIEVKVLDHLIIGNTADSLVSLAAQGYPF